MIHNLAAGHAGFTSNAFLVEGQRSVLIDVGNEFDIVGAIQEIGETPDAVVLTHTHADHIGNLGAVTETFNVAVWGFDDTHKDVDHRVEDGASIRLGDHTYEALHTPGHKNDHLCFYGAEPRILFAGDLIFANGGFGRTDLDEGDRPTLVESIRRVASIIDTDLQAMHTGHGPSVTTNPAHDVELALQAAQMGR